jgi:hypothetical protein
VDPVVENDELPTLTRSFEAQAVKAQDHNRHSKRNERRCQKHVSWPSLGFFRPDVAAKCFVVSGSDERGDYEGHEREHERIENRGQSSGEHSQLFNLLLPSLGHLFENPFLFLQLLLVLVRNWLVLRAVWLRRPSHQRLHRMGWRRIVVHGGDDDFAGLKRSYIR